MRTFVFHPRCDVHLELFTVAVVPSPTNDWAVCGIANTTFTFLTSCRSVVGDKIGHIIAWINLHERFVPKPSELSGVWN